MHTISRRQLLLLSGGGTVSAIAAAALPRLMEAQATVAASDGVLGTLLREIADTHNAIKQAGPLVRVAHLRRASGNVRLLSAHLQQTGYDARLQQLFQRSDRNQLVTLRHDPAHERMTLQQLGFDLQGEDIATTDLDTAAKDKVIVELATHGSGRLFAHYATEVDAIAQRGEKRGLVRGPVAPPHIRLIGQIDYQDFDYVGGGGSIGPCFGVNALRDYFCFAATVACTFGGPADPLCLPLIASCGLGFVLGYICEIWT